MTDEVRNRPGQEPRVPPEPPDIKTEAGMLPPGVLMGEPSGLTRGDIAAAIDRLMDKALADGFDRNKLLWPLIYAYRSVGWTAFIEEQGAQRDRLRAALELANGMHFEHDLNCGLPTPTSPGGDCDCGVESAYEAIHEALGLPDEGWSKGPDGWEP